MKDSTTYQSSQKWSAKREARASATFADAPASRQALAVSTWELDSWSTFFDMYLEEFEVDSRYWSQANKYQKKATLAAYVSLGEEALESPAALLEATLNLIVTWNDEDFGFYYSKPEIFHLGYLSKAWDSYKKSVQKNPALRLAAYQISDEFTDRIKILIGDGNTSSWLDKPTLEIPTSDVIQDILDQDLDNLL